MVIKGNPPQLRPTRLEGLVSFRYLKDGRVIAQKWPRKRPGTLPQVTADQTAVWDMAQEWVKTPEPRDYAMALEATNGTAFYARDILVCSMYGNYVSWPGYGWRFKLAQDAQALLDTISETIGSLLVRTAEGWVGLVPQAAGDVLTDGGPGQSPTWQPAPASPTADNARAYINTATNTQTGGWHKIPLDTVQFDPAGLWDAVNKRFIPTKAGYYNITGRARTNTGGQIVIGIGINGSPFAVSDDLGGSTIPLAQAGSGLFHLNGTTDYVELWAFTTTVRALTLGPGDTWLSLSGPL